MVDTLEPRSAAGTRTVQSDLVREILSLRNGDHLCLVYDHEPAGQLPALLPFLRQGLERGERCLYVADDQTIDRLRRALRGHGVDAEAEAARGALLLWTRDDWPLSEDLSARAPAARVHGLIQDALAEGYTGMRLVVEMTCMLGADVDVALLRGWEHAINSIFTPEAPARLICQYSRRSLGPAAIHAALTTHPLAVVGGELYPNPYYDARAASATVNSPTPTASEDGANVDWMLSRLRRVRAFQSEREERIRAQGAIEEAEGSRPRLEQLYAEARAAAEELKRVVAVKDEFVGLVSHELKTPITVILGNAHVLLKTLDGLPDAKQEALRDIRSEAERLNRIVNNLLILAKIEGRQEPEFEPILIVPILDKVIEEHRRRHQRREIKMSRPASGAPTFGNPVYVEQILVNLLGNAEKYSPDGAPIEVELGVDDTMRVVRVLDRGIGVGGADREKVFEPFYRTGEAANTSAGIGIGLTVCKRLVEVQGGRMWAAEREGGGSEFGFTLRLCDPVRE